jgi:hypothetical protein
VDAHRKRHLNQNYLTPGNKREGAYGCRLDLIASQNTSEIAKLPPLRCFNASKVDANAWAISSFIFVPRNPPCVAFLLHTCLSLTFDNCLLGFGDGGVYGAVERGRHAAPAVFALSLFFATRLGS